MRKPNYKQDRRMRDIQKQEKKAAKEAARREKVEPTPEDDAAASGPEAPDET